MMRRKMKSSNGTLNVSNIIDKKVLNPSVISFLRLGGTYRPNNHGSIFSIL